jgi:hypothetical protein
LGPNRTYISPSLFSPTCTLCLLAVDAGEPNGAQEAPKQTIAALLHCLSECGETDRGEIKLGRRPSQQVGQVSPQIPRHSTQYSYILFPAHMQVPYLHHVIALFHARTHIFSPFVSASSCKISRHERMRPGGNKTQHVWTLSTPPIDATHRGPLRRVPPVPWADAWSGRSSRSNRQRKGCSSGCRFKAPSHCTPHTLR